MQLNGEEDEKTADPFTYDERLVTTTRYIFEQKSEDLLKLFNS